MVELVVPRPQRLVLTEDLAHRLLEAGLLRQGMGEGLDVDPAAVHRLIEELAPLGVTAEPGPNATQMGQPFATATWQNGPKLIVVKGASEGSSYPLQGGKHSWILGRDVDADVPLAFDPYVSRHSGEVWQDGEDYYLEDLTPFKNGVYLNWRRLDRREAAHLEDGDIIGVGRTLLVFRST